MTLTNLPRRCDNAEVIGVLAENNTIELRSKSDAHPDFTLHMVTIGHCQLRNIDPQVVQYLADRIASLVCEARDRGYEHARADIRRALGVQS